MSNRRRIGACLIVAAFLTVGAGGSDESTPPAAWVQSLCTSIVDWGDALAAAQSDEDVMTRNLERRRTAIVQFLRKATQATDTLLEDLDEAGTPDVPDGDRIRAAFRKGFNQARKAFARARKDAKKLDVDDRQEFNDAAGDIAAAISRGGGQVDETFTEAAAKYGSDELDQAYDAEPSCAGLN
jgi:hypothetical protein